MAVGVIMEDGQEDHVEKVRREGSIVRIKMKDFITYDSVECTPGESLNVVIGPNGTGKSTILSAIVLGLGGKPTLLGKPQANITEFIKNERQEAQIEIELLRVKKKNTIIRRTIFRDGKSIWNLNGRQVRVADIEAETKALNIQIDNLCQVLPQDRVQDFAKLNKQELLEATQKAVGKDGMSEIHSKLKGLQKQQEQLKQQIISDNKKKELEQGKVDRMRGAVEKMDKRRGIEAEADAARLKLSIVNYQQKKDEMGQVKNQLNEAETKVTNLQKAVEPFKQQITEAESKLNTVKNKNHGSDRKISKQFDVVSKLRGELERLRDEILELEVNLESQLKRAESQTQKEEEIRQAISKYRNDIASLESMSPQQIEAKLRQMEQEMRRLAQLTSQAESEKMQMDSEIREEMNELEALNQKIRRTEDQKQNRLRALHMVDQDAYQASRWIEANRNLFEAPVYLPMIVELDVQPQFGKYIANAVGFQDLKAITCESKRDMKIVIDNCRKQQKLVVNVLEVNPNLQPVEPSVPLNDLRRRYPQFQGYLKDFVKGPSTLINFLCHRKQFHEIPVALTEIEADLPRYYTADLKKSISGSRFGSGVMYTSDHVRPSNSFQATASDGDIDDLRRSVDVLKGSIDQKKNNQTAKLQEIKDTKSKREQIRKEQGMIRQTQTNIQTMRFHLSRKEKDLAELQQNRKDPDQIRRSFKVKAKVAVLKLVEAQEPFYEALKQLDFFVIESQMLEFEVQAAKALVNQTKRLCKTEQEALEKAERDVEVIRNNYLATKTEVTQLLKDIERKNRKKLLDIWNDPDNKRIFQTLPDSPDELEVLIADKAAHAEMLGDGNEADVRHFEQLVKQLEALTVSISEREIEVAKLDEDMKRRENEWKEELNELVGTISSNFSRYFREMGCAGEVVLYTGNSEHDYDNYGLRVRVKFRDAEDLQDLNAHTQSGGERAVSTAIYMLSLQELTPAPFRLVDEINQGMDSKNERRVYNLLMRSTSRPGTPQYFLLTPKLLKEMDYGAGTTVLCVMNSACAPDHRTWNLKEFIKLRERLGSNGRSQPRRSGQFDSDDE